MRLDLIYRVLLDNTLTLNITNTNDGRTIVSDLKRFQNSINNIEKTGTFQDKIKKLKGTILYTSESDYYQVDNITIKHIKDVTQLENDIKVLTDNLLYILPKDRKDVIFVKLPELKDFDAISQFAKDIQRLFTQLVIQDPIKGCVSFDGVEAGSSWFKIYVGTSFAITLIGCAVWSATVIQKKMEEVNTLKEQTKTLKFKNENLQNLTEANKILLNTYVEIEAHKIADKIFKDYDNEQIERLKNSIRTLTELINKGVEVQPALSSPEDVKQLFPGMDQLGLAKSEIKKLKE